MIVEKSFGLKLASVDTQVPGEFLGTALVYGERDSLGDSIKEGCFQKSIRDAQGSVPLLWHHDPREVLGTIHVEADARMLSVRGELLVDAVPKAREVHALLKARAIRGLSVGFAVIRSAPRQDGGTEYTEARLLEVSLTATPAYQSAQVHQVRDVAGLTHLAKSLDVGGHREALRALRLGIDAMLDESDPGGLSPADLLDALTFDPGKWGD